MSKPSFGDTLTAGIQDISSLLPLLGTGQCEDHVSSALTKGYLYAAATPVSIFGSLGMARAGFKTLVAGISSLYFNGARTLENMGFKPQGANLSLIMYNGSGDGRYLVESRLDALLKELHIDNANKIKPSVKCAEWNIKTIIATASLCMASIVPYIHLNLQDNTLGSAIRWLFPIIRTVGGFLVATMIQLIIQNRILVIVTQSLMIKVAEEALKELQELPEGLGDSREDLDLESQLHCLERYLEQYPNYIDDASDSHVKEAGQQNGPKQSDTTHPDIEKGKEPTNATEESIGNGNLSIYKVGDSEFQSPPTHTALEGIGNRDSVTENVTPSVRISFSQYEKLRELKRRLREARRAGLTYFETIVCSTLLLAGIIASVVGYIGCFSVVQGSKSPYAPAIWLGLEALLSIIRMLLWGWNPRDDDLPPFTLEFKLNSPPFLSTCNKFAEEIDEEKVLPLVRAPEFLESVTAYAGRLERFEDPNLALYYAITRKEGNPHQRALYIAIFDLAERTMRIYAQPTKGKEVYYSTAELLEIDLECAVLQIKIEEVIDPNNDPVASNVNARSLLAKHYQSILDEMGSRDNGQGDADNIRNQWTFRTEDLTRKEWQLLPPGNPDKEVSLQDELLYLNHGKLERLNRHFREERVKWIKDYMEILQRDIDDKFYDVKLELQRREEGARKTEKGEPMKEMTRESVKDNVEEESRRLQEKVNAGVRKETGSQETQIYVREEGGGSYAVGEDGELNEEGEDDNKSLENIRKGEREVKELLIMAEWWMLEIILLHEILGWEGELLEDYKGMTRKIFDGKDDSIGKHLKKMLEKSWLTNSWIRLSENRRVSEARWEDVMGRERRKLLDQSVNHDYRPKLWNWSEGVGAGEWDSLLKGYTKKFQESDFGKPERYGETRDLIEFKEPRSMLDNFLRQSHIEDKARKCGGEWMRKAVHDWCVKMKCRLKREVEEMEARLGYGLDHCREFQSSREYFNLIHGSSKWLCLSRYILNGGIDSICRLLEKNKHRTQDILYIGLLGFTDDELAELTPILRNMTSLTTICLVLKGNCIGDKAHTAILGAINENENIISITGLGSDIDLTKEIKAALQRNIDKLGNRTAISFKMLGIGLDYLALGDDQCNFTLRFLAPAEGNLTLRICHSSRGDGVSLQVKEVKSFQHEVPRRRDTEDIIFLSHTHFIPGRQTTLTFVPNGWYDLYDIQLLDEAQNPYNATSDVSHLDATASNVPDTKSHFDVDTNDVE